MDDIDRKIIEELKKKLGEDKVHFCGYCERIVCASKKFFYLHLDVCEEQKARKFLHNCDRLDKAEDEFFKEDDDKGWIG